MAAFGDLKAGHVGDCRHECRHVGVSRHRGWTRCATPALAADRERCLALLAIATRAPIDPDTMLHLQAAAAYWDRGDKALANLRLVFAGLPKLRDPADAARLRAAEYLLDHGMPPRDLLREVDDHRGGRSCAARW